MSDSLGINLKTIIIWPNNNGTCYEIAIAKETNITAIFQGKLLGCLATEIFYGLRYGFKWQSGSQNMDALFKWKRLCSNAKV